MTVFENIRCGLLWSRGYRYSFWHLLGGADGAERARPTGCSSGSSLDDRRDLPAGLLSYAEQRALEIGITIAGGADIILLDEPTAGMSRSETEHAVALIRARHRGQDPAHGRARHERGVRPRRPHHRAGLRRGHRLRHARPRSAATRAVQEAYLGTRGAPDARGRATCTPSTARATSCRASTSTVGEGEIVSLLGRNGVGRSTTCKAIMGLVPPVGEIRFKGQPIAGLRPDQIAHAGHRLRAGGPPDLPRPDRARRTSSSG